MHPDLPCNCQQTCITYTIAVGTAKTPDDGQKNCLKYAEFHSKNKFVKLVHLVGFIIRNIAATLGFKGQTVKVNEALCHKLS
jgi:hypothetical protein